jgi:molecular chaperone GrpE
LEELVTETNKIIKVEGGSEKSKEDKRVAGAIEKHSPTAPVRIEDKDQVLSAGAEGHEPHDPLQEARKLADENRDRWLRSVAELENYKKRSAQERSKLLKYKNEELLRDLLGVSDNLERAISHCDPSRSPAGLLEGLRLVADMQRDILAKYGVAPIESVGKPFDPNFHEALARVESAELPPNTVTEEMEKGYLYHDRLLRPSKVIISA